MTDTRITVLEERLAHLERAAEELSDIVTAQRGEIDRLTRLVDMLTQREAQRDSDAGAYPFTDERPPHW